MTPIITRFVAVLVLGTASTTYAQMPYTVADPGSGTTPYTLGWAIEQVNAHPTAHNVITINTGVTVSGTSQYFINANVTIDGQGQTVDMQGKDRAFFVAGGNVVFSNLTIKNGVARGGDGGDGGGAALASVGRFSS
jgi:hypothetical protein